MILESVVLSVVPGREEEFLRAFDAALPLIACQHGFGGLELRRSVDPGRGARFLLQVRWARLADHTEGFRRSAEYARWREILHGFYAPVPEVEHFDDVLVTR